MFAYILILIILKMLEAPTWCFVLAWIGIACKCIDILRNVYERGKEKGEQNGK